MIITTIKIETWRRSGRRSIHQNRLRSTNNLTSSKTIKY